MSGVAERLAREADELDLEIFRTIGRMLAFSEKLPRPQQKPLRDAAVHLGAARNLVRSHMTEARREETA